MCVCFQYLCFDVFFQQINPQYMPEVYVSRQVSNLVFLNIPNGIF
jgi:hypothetical protein